MNRKLIYGVATNDADYTTEKREDLGCVDGKRKRRLLWRCPFYTAWKSMLRRCYSTACKNRQPAYKDVTCCEEWLLFSNFKKWMEQQDWRGKQLDKDIISPGNKQYSPVNCAFVRQATNLFVVDGNCFNSLIGEKYVARCHNPITRRNEHLGLFSSQSEARYTWMKRKHELSQLVAKMETDQRVAEALKKRYSTKDGVYLC